MRAAGEEKRDFRKTRVHGVTVGPNASDQRYFPLSTQEKLFSPTYRN